MNVCFLIVKSKLEEKFNMLCHNAGISGLKGHRSVGGYRASIYNAMPIESIQLLINIMKQIEDEQDD